MNNLKYDLLVIGTGVAGQTIAHKCASGGLHVAAADYRPFGGTCPLRGCDPKKVMLGIAEVVKNARALKGKGIGHSPSIHWKDLMRFKKCFTDPVPDHVEKSFQNAGIDTFHEQASFISDNRIKLGDWIIEADKIAITTGSQPADLNIPGKKYLITSEDFLSLDHLPEHITFVGGGYIAFEFAHLAAVAGAKVTILHKGSVPLENFEPDMAGHLTKVSREMNIDILVNAEVTGIEKNEKGFLVKKGKEIDQRDIYSELVVHSAGRVPDIETMNPEAAGIEIEKYGIRVNEYLQNTSNPHVYAAGDSASSRGLPLTPVAKAEGGIVASNILEGNRQKIDYTGLQTVVHTIPPLAATGLTEKQAKARYSEIEVKSGLADNWFNARRLKESGYAYKIILNNRDDTILGATILGPHAEETINLFSLAIKSGMKRAELKSMYFAYPSFAADIPSMI